MHRIIRNINSTKPRKIAIKARKKSHALSQGGKACPDVSAYNTRTNQLFLFFPDHSLVLQQLFGSVPRFVWPNRMQGTRGRKGKGRKQYYLSTRKHVAHTWLSIVEVLSAHIAVWYLLVLCDEHLENSNFLNK